MNINDSKRYEYKRKYHEYEMKIVKMAGYLTDHFIDKAIETEDFSQISSFLIDYFSGSVGKNFDVGYLISKYKEFKLNEKVEDIDFKLEEWYKIKYELSLDSFENSLLDQDINMLKMNENEYIDYMISKRKGKIKE